MKNFIPISRKLFKHALWLEARAFSRFEAWLDLLVTARFDASPTSAFINKQLVSWGYGQMPVSLRYLAERWGWTKGKTETFIALLKREGMVTTQTAPGTNQTIITICNYDEYNSGNEINRIAKGRNTASNTTATNQPTDKTNIDNIVKNSKHREDKPIYRQFAHLVLYTDDFERLQADGFTAPQIDAVLDAVENYKANTKYRSLYLTARNWLARDKAAVALATAPKKGRIVNIANAFEQALQHG